MLYLLGEIWGNTKHSIPTFKEFCCGIKHKLRKWNGILKEVLEGNAELMAWWKLKAVTVGCEPHLPSASALSPRLASLCWSLCPVEISSSLSLSVYQSSPSMAALSPCRHVWGPSAATSPAASQPCPQLHLSPHRGSSLTPLPAHFSLPWGCVFLWCKAGFSKLSLT